MVKDIKGCKMPNRTRKVAVKHFSGAKTKNTKSYIILAVKQKHDNIILHTGTNELKNTGTPEEITRGILNLAMTCKADTNIAFLYLVLSQDPTSLMSFKSKQIFFHVLLDNKHIPPRFHCNRSGL